MYSFDTRVRYSELAEDQKCSLVAIIQYFQDCCTFEAEDGGVGLAWLGKHHTAWMLADWQIHIERRPAYGEWLRITTWASDFHRMIGKRCFTVEDRDTGERLVYAFSDWVYVDVQTGKLERNVPAEELRVYGLKDPLPDKVIPGHIPVPDPAETGEETFWHPDPIRVTEMNLDPNHHVNNAQYIAIAMSLLPDSAPAGADFSLLRAEYKIQSHLGDILIPTVAEKQGVYTVTLDNEAGKHKLVAQFS